MSDAADGIRACSWHELGNGSVGQRVEDADQWPI
jgi:hypothetical protein